MNESVELKFSKGPRKGRSLLLCPECGFDYLHITKATVHRGTDKIAIAKGNIMVKDEPNTNRGVAIIIEYLGECRHRGEIIFQFYKGNIEVYHRPLPELEHGDIDDIFRD